MRKWFKPINVCLVLLGSLIQAVGLCNIHAYSNVTEGGTLGLTLLIQHWTGLSPAISSLILNALCFAFGWRILGRCFLMYSLLACGAYSLFYALLEPFAPLWPAITEQPLAAALLGALFVGTGAGLSVRAGGAPSGDDALAMALSTLLKTGIQNIYLASDLIVLLLSLSYISWQRIAFSLLTVILSGQIIGWLQRVKVGKPGTTPPPQQPL